MAAVARTWRLLRRGALLIFLKGIEMRTAKLLILIALLGSLLLAGNGRGTISGNVADPDGIVRIDATSLNTGERFSVAADANGGFTLRSLPAGEYRVVFHNAAGTASARRLLKVRAGEILRLEAKLTPVRPISIDGRRTAVRKAAAATADVPPVVQQFGESARYLNAVVLLDDNHGWAVGDTRWDQATHTTKGTIINTTDGGATWSNQDPGVAVNLSALFFLNANQGWAVGDNGTTVRTTDGGAHWTQAPVATASSFESVFFTDALNGWATANAVTQYDVYNGEGTDYQACIWHTTDGGQTWTQQTVPASASLLKRVFFVNATTGFAAGLTRTGYNYFGDPQVLGGIYGTTDGGKTWNQIYTTSQGLTFTSLYFTDANNGWAAGFALSSIYSDAFGFHTTDGGKTWQGQSTLNQGEVFTQVRDLRMLDNNRGYAVGTAYEGDGTAVWRTLDGGTTWTGIRMTNTNPLEADGYWGLALTADRVRIVGDRDVTAYSSQPWTACSNSYPDTCEPLFTQANITPHYAFEDVFFLDKNHGWAAGTRTFSPQLWGQEIFATQDGGQTWTSQFERGLTDGLFSYFRLDSISFADANNGWAAGSSEMFDTASTYAELGCILHTTDGGKTWTDQAASICGNSIDEFSVVQALDAQNVWALGTNENLAGHVQLAHSTNGGNTWTVIDSGISGLIAVGFGEVQGALHFVDAQHGCFSGSYMVACTSDGGAHWTLGTIDGQTSSFPYGKSIAYADSNHVWLGGGSLYDSTNAGVNWLSKTLSSTSEVTVEGIQFPTASAGWLAANGGLLYQTTDAGADWQPVNSGTSNDLFGLSFVDATHGWIAGDYGTILSYAGDRTVAGKPAVFAAVNAASYTYQTAPAAWISIFGENLSATTRSWTAADFNGNNLPTKLDGVSVLVNGSPAYLSFISPGQINAMFPDGGSTGQATVQVVNSAGSSGTLAVQEGVYSPSLFRLSTGGGQYVIVQNAKLQLTSTVKPGDIIVLYGTGFGPTSPATASASLVTAPAQTASSVTFTIGGLPATVQWAGMIGPGLYQFNVQMPSGAVNGDLVIVAGVGGAFSQSDSVIAVSGY
jgi:uncharacterized protein (TIGR03437 family)